MNADAGLAPHIRGVLDSMAHTLTSSLRYDEAGALYDALAALEPRTEKWRLGAALCALGCGDGARALVALDGMEGWQDALMRDCARRLRLRAERMTAGDLAA